MKFPRSLSAITCKALATAVLFGGALCPLVAESQSSSGQNSQDVPKDSPSTNNPDVGKQRQPVPPAPKGKSQPQPGDVPQQEQEPNTNNPGIAKQRQPKPRAKRAKPKSTSNAQRPQPQER